jgi:hypothetical protein
VLIADTSLFLREKTMLEMLMTQSRSPAFDGSVIDTHSLTGNCLVGDPAESLTSLLDHRSRPNSQFVELTLVDLIHDPLVASLNRADDVTFETYMQLLLSAARRNAKRLF